MTSSKGYCASGSTNEITSHPETQTCLCLAQTVAISQAKCFAEASQAGLSSTLLLS